MQRQCAERGVLSRERTAVPDELEVFNAQNTITAFDNLLSHSSSTEICHKFNLLVHKFEGSIRFVKISAVGDVEYLVTVTEDMKCSAVYRSVPVIIRDLLGFNISLSRWSQLDAVISRVKDTVPNPKSVVSNYCNSTSVQEAYHLALHRLQ